MPANLEKQRQVESLRSAVRKTKNKTPWLERLAGTFQYDPLFDEMVEAGRRYRNSLSRRSHHRRKAIVSSIVLSCAITSLAASSKNLSQLQKPNLSGTWKLDKSKGNYVKYARLKSQDDLMLLISHVDPEIKVVHKLIKNGKQDTRELIYYSDGRGETGYTFMDDSPGKSKTTWRGNKLVSRFFVNLNGRGATVTFEVVQEWKLSADGKTLTQTQTVRQTNLPITTAGGSSREATIAEELSRNLNQSLPANEIVRVFNRLS